MGLKEIGCEYVDWIHLTQEGAWRQALVILVMNLFISYKVESFSTR
jgi:hypothetical protein